MLPDVVSMKVSDNAVHCVVLGGKKPLSLCERSEVRCWNVLAQARTCHPEERSRSQQTDKQRSIAGHLDDVSLWILVRLYLCKVNVEKMKLGGGSRNRLI